MTEYIYIYIVSILTDYIYIYIYIYIQSHLSNRPPPQIDHSPTPIASFGHWFDSTRIRTREVPIPRFPQTVYNPKTTVQNKTYFKLNF